MAGFVAGPTGEAAVFVAPTWSGDLVAGEAAVAPCCGSAQPVAGGVGPLPYPELIRMFEAGRPARPALHARHPMAPTLTDDAIEVLAEAASTWSSASSLLALHHFHGAATRVAPDATAFALRQEHVLAEVIAAWPAVMPLRTAPGSRGSRTPSRPGRCPVATRTSSGPDDTERARLGFGANADRLLAAKRRYDPDGVLTAIASLGA